MKAYISNIVNCHDHRILGWSDTPCFAHTRRVSIANISSVHVWTEIKASESIQQSTPFTVLHNTRKKDSQRDQTAVQPPQCSFFLFLAPCHFRGCFWLRELLCILNVFHTAVRHIVFPNWAHGALITADYRYPLPKTLGIAVCRYSKCPWRFPLSANECLVMIMIWCGWDGIARHLTEGRYFSPPNNRTAQRICGVTGLQVGIHDHVWIHLGSR